MPKRQLIQKRNALHFDIYMYNIIRVLYFNFNKDEMGKINNTVMIFLRFTLPLKTIISNYIKITKTLDIQGLLSLCMIRLLLLSVTVFFVFVSLTLHSLYLASSYILHISSDSFSVL